MTLKLWFMYMTLQHMILQGGGKDWELRISIPKIGIPFSLQFADYLPVVQWRSVYGTSQFSFLSEDI